MRVIGVADIGSNSTHLLVAATDGHQVEPVVDLSEPIELGSAIARRGEIGKGLSLRVAATLSDYRARARALGAEGLAVVATEPLRRAADRIEASRRIADQYDGSIAALTHEEEGLLAVLGLRHQHDRSSPLIVADVGGGSTEVVLLAPGRAHRGFGASIGCATLSDEVELSDPPRPKEWRELRVRAVSGLRQVSTLQASRVVLAGGTATNLLKLLPATLISREITPRDLAAAGEILAASRAARVAEVHALSLRRARLLPAGLAILEALLSHTEAEAAVVDRGGIREGLVLAVAHAGGNWRDALSQLVSGASGPAANHASVRR